MSQKTAKHRWLVLGLIALFAATVLAMATPAQANPQLGELEQHVQRAGLDRAGHSQLQPDWLTLLPPAIEVNAGSARDDGIPDIITIAMSESNASISINGTAHYTGHAPHIVVEGSSDDDTLQVVVEGSAVSTISFSGGDHQTETGDVLDLSGNTGSVAYYPHSNGEPRAGTVVASNGGLQIDFEGIEPFATSPDLTASEPNLIFFVDLSFAPEITEVIIEDDPTDTAGPGATRMVPLSDTNQFEWASFVGYESMIVWSGAGPETIRYRGVDPNSGLIGMLLYGSDVVYDDVTGFFVEATDPANDTILIEGSATPIDFIVAAGWLGSDTITVGSAYSGDVLLLGGSGEIWVDDVDAALLAFTGDGINRLTAGAGDDYLAGGDNIDYLRGGAGNDTIDGLLSIDRMWGGTGDDDLFGGGGSDRIRGGPGIDYIYAGSGADRVWGGGDDDLIFGQGGQDSIWGEGGNDEIQGNSQSDDIWGGNGNDQIGGATGKDELWGQAGNDTLNGGTNSDILRGGDGLDILNGGAGRDTCIDTATDSYSSC